MADETPEKDEQEAKPPRRRGRRADQAPVEASAQETPKRGRAKAPAVAPEEAAAEKPKRRASRAKAAEASDATASAEAPKPRRTRARAAAEETPAAEQSTRTSPEGTEEEAPKPRRTRARAAAAEEPAAGAAKPPAAPRRPRGRPAIRRRNGKAEPVRDDVLVYATARYVRSSARKARIVCNHIRGKSVPEARAILQFAPRAVAKDWAKLLNSAVANAEHNFELIGDELRIKEAYADEGPTLKRFRPRAMGRATPIHKKTSHLSITLTPEA
jgi:ribosomal protein L22